MTRASVYGAGYVVIVLGLGLAAWLVNVPLVTVLLGTAAALAVWVTKVIRRRKNVDESGAHKQQ